MGEEGVGEVWGEIEARFAASSSELLPGLLSSSMDMDTTGTHTHTHTRKPEIPI